MKSIKSYEEIMKAAEELATSASNSFAETEESLKADIATALATDDIEKRCGILSRVIERVEAVYGAAVAEDGTTFPKYLTVVTFQNDGKSLGYTVKSKLNHWYQTRRKIIIDFNEEAPAKISTVLKDVLYELYYAEASKDGVEQLNFRLQGIKDKFGLKFDVTFAYTPDTARVVSITDTGVVLKIREDSALKISSLSLMFNEPEKPAGATDTDGEDSPYERTLYELALQKYVEIMKTVQTTPEILKKHIAPIEALAGIGGRELSYKMIREGVHKKAEFITDGKGEVGYYYDTKESVFALLRKDDGVYSYVLKPYNPRTNLYVDVDVISKLA